MSTIAPTQPTLSLPLPAPEEVVRITVDRYEQMVESGLLPEDDPIELLSGVMVWKMPKNPKHSTQSRRCQRIIENLLPPGWHVRKEEPVRIPDYDEPEPDLAVVRGDDDHYEDRHPSATDVALIIEIAESSLNRDRGEKRDVYARAGIAAYWILNLLDRQLECHAKPTVGVYPPATIVGETGSVELIIEGQTAGRIAVADMLPKP